MKDNNPLMFAAGNRCMLLVPVDLTASPLSGCCASVPPWDCVSWEGEDR